VFNFILAFRLFYKVSTSVRFPHAEGFVSISMWNVAQEGRSCSG